MRSEMRGKEGKQESLPTLGKCVLFRNIQFLSGGYFLAQDEVIWSRNKSVFDCFVRVMFFGTTSYSKPYPAL